jgi:hypothetical protein
MSRAEILEELRALVRPLFPEADVKVVDSAVRVSWRTNDEPARPNKRVQPILISFGEEVMDNLTRAEVRELPERLAEAMVTFVSGKLATFQPRTTSGRHESHVPEEWVYGE